MGMFTFHLKQQNVHDSESYYIIEPKDEADIIQKIKNNNTEEFASRTNKAFNENEEYKHYAQAYQPIAPPKDYEYIPKQKQNSSNNNQITNRTSQNEIDDTVLTSFDNVNSVLKKQQNNLTHQSVKKESSMHYSLINRTHEYLPTPVYLCERGGKVVVNIVVNAYGMVTKTTINNASSSQNQCLKDHALEYAGKARFDTDTSKKTQIGTITFYFESKY